jgi:hypothetical protein
VARPFIQRAPVNPYSDVPTVEFTVERLIDGVETLGALGPQALELVDSLSLSLSLSLRSSIGAATVALARGFPAA